MHRESGDALVVYVLTAGVVGWKIWAGNRVDFSRCRRVSASSRSSEAKTAESV